MEWEKLRDLTTEQLHHILSYFDITEADVLIAKDASTKATCFLIRSKCPLQTYKITASSLGKHAMYIDRSVSIAKWNRSTR